MPNYILKSSLSFAKTSLLRICWRNFFKTLKLFPGLFSPVDRRPKQKARGEREWIFGSREWFIRAGLEILNCIPNFLERSKKQFPIIENGNLIPWKQRRREQELNKKQWRPNMWTLGQPCDAISTSVGHGLFIMQMSLVFHCTLVSSFS